MILARGVVSRWDGTPNVVVSEMQGVNTGAMMPDVHDWHLTAVGNPGKLRSRSDRDGRE